ncbi:MAG: hypothetical protein HY308_11645 [Gammaproteobacteria bacterium]|nr:hypothetical protein [Gammaproteobacteria bacterium]
MVAPEQNSTVKMHAHFLLGLLLAILLPLQSGAALTGHCFHSGALGTESHASHEHGSEQLQHHGDHSNSDSKKSPIGDISGDHSSCPASSSGSLLPVADLRLDVHVSSDTPEFWLVTLSLNHAVDRFERPPRLILA